MTDSTVEPTETFTLTLSTPTNATIADGTGVATLTNDDVVIPTIAVNDVTMAEGTGGVATAVFTVTLSAATTQTVTVAYATVNGTAIAPGDYASTAGTLTFAPRGDDAACVGAARHGQHGRADRDVHADAQHADERDDRGWDRCRHAHQ